MDYNLWQELILGSTKPFRTGANILAQNWGSALTGKDMGKKENQGKFLKWLASGITPKEQKEIAERPYREAIKSSAGMASVFGPTSGASILNTMKDSAIRNAMYSLGTSQTGNELKDMLSGALIGSLMSGVGSYGKYIGTGGKPLSNFGNIAQEVGGGERLTQMDMPIPTRGSVGYSEGIANLINKYSNVRNPQTFGQFAQSVYPEFRGNLSSLLGKQAYGNTILNPLYDTSSLMSPKWESILSILGNTSLPLSVLNNITRKRK